jgi:hypothetical protein
MGTGSGINLFPNRVWAHLGIEGKIPIMGMFFIWGSVFPYDDPHTET